MIFLYIYAYSDSLCGYCLCFDLSPSFQPMDNDSTRGSLRVRAQLKIGVHGFKGSEFKPALVRRDVAIKLLSHPMGLAFHHHTLTRYIWARGSILVHRRAFGCVFTRKPSASSGLIQNLEPNWLLFGKMSIFN